MSADDSLMDGKTEKTVGRIQKTFLVLALIETSFALDRIADQEFADFFEISWAVVIYVSIYLGLRSRRAWVLPLILLYSAFSCFWRIQHLLILAQETGMLTVKVYYCLLLFFFAYLLVFFSKQQVKRLFGVKGRVIF